VYCRQLRTAIVQPGVGGAIVGVRLGILEHIEDAAKVFSFSVDAENSSHINQVSSKSQDLYQIIGDFGDEYRRWMIVMAKILITSQATFMSVSNYPQDIHSRLL
jgi:hypothetical protein